MDCGFLLGDVFYRMYLYDFWILNFSPIGSDGCGHQWPRNR
jgi:hypothetical protein